MSTTKKFFVGRVKRNLFQQSYVGAIFTDGHPAQGQSGRTYGADMRLATSRFLGRPSNFVVNAYGVRSVERGRVGQGLVVRLLGVTTRTTGSRRRSSLREIQENFRPALGFVQRDNVRMLRMAGSYNPRPTKFLNIQQMFHDVYFTRFTRLDNGEVESWDLYVTLLDWHFKLRRQPPRHVRLQPDLRAALRAVRDLARGGAGAGRVPLHALPEQPDRDRRQAAAVGQREPPVTADYWSGKAEQVTTGVTYKLPPRFIVTLSTNQTFARLPEGHFIARIFTTNVSYARSPTLSFSNLVQYDNRSRNLGWQSRVRWTLQPGNDLFLAFNQGWIQELDGRDDLRLGRRFRAQDSKLSAKFQYSFRF